jgi:CII-binding regulator of phage lambda lysogenization HflD
MNELNEDQEIMLLKQDVANFKQQNLETIHKLQKDLAQLDIRVKEMEMSKQKTEYQYEQIMQSLKTLNEQTIPNLTSQIQELKNKPVKRYDQAITSIIAAIFGAIGAAIVSIFIKK